MSQRGDFGVYELQAARVKLVRLGPWQLVTRVEVTVHFGPFLDVVLQEGCKLWISRSLIISECSKINW